MKHLFLVAGEISGDTHGTALLEALQAADGELEFSGLGGRGMHGVSPDIEDWLEEAAVLGFVEVLKKYRYFSSKMEETVARIFEAKPAAVIFIDYPGFNLRLAKRLREGGYKGKLLYYISPQVWAWKRGRIKTMAELLDLMICIFPFEKVLYEQSGLKTVFAGHPLVDELEEKTIDCERDSGLVALLPGSREREIEALFPAMIDAAVELRESWPKLRFASAAVSPKLIARLTELAEEREVLLELDLPMHELMQRATVGVVASGTATLEAAYFRLPYCLTYKVAWLTAMIGRAVMKVDFLGIVNVIAEREVVRELLQEQATGPSIAAELGRLLDDEGARQALQKALTEVTDSLGGGGAHQSAARAVLEAVP